MVAAEISPNEPLTELTRAVADSRRCRNSFFAQEVTDFSIAVKTSYCFSSPVVSRGFLRPMEAVAEGLWALAEHHEQRKEIDKAVKCLEAICQSPVSFLPIIEIKTRLRIATLLLKHTHNINHAKAHLERSQLLLKSIPSCFELKCRAYSLLSQCYHLVGAIPSQKQMLKKGLEISAVSGDGFSGKLWFCNFNSQLASALIIEGDYNGSTAALQQGLSCSVEMCYPELQMFFATSLLHVQLIQWDDTSLVEETLARCNVIWDSIEPDKQQRQCLGLLFYHELLHLFYLLRICDFKNAAQHIDKLDAVMKSDLQRMQQVQELTIELDKLKNSLLRSDLNYRERSALSEKQTNLEEQLGNCGGMDSTGKTTLEPTYFGNVKRAWADKLELAAPPIDGEWLPKSVIYALVDLMVVVFNRPKGLFKECGKRIQSGMLIIQEELVQLGITDGVKEVELQHSAIWISGVYLMLLMQFLENKVAVDLTRTEFVEAQEALIQMQNWFVRFPTILQDCESGIEILRGHYAHSVGCYSEATFHFLEASKLTQSKSKKATCHIYAAVSFICLGDAESYAKAVDLIGPVLGVIDSFVGVREKTSALYSYGFLLMRQQNVPEARLRLASGLQITHTHMGNLQLVSQYLTLLGNLALSLHDFRQAKEILRSALTLSRKLYDISTQNWILSNMTALYQQSGEKESEIENVQYQRRKTYDLQQRLAVARSSIHHNELIDKVKLQAPETSESGVKRLTAGPSKCADLDIPESVGLASPQPRRSSARLMDLDITRHGKRKA